MAMPHERPPVNDDKHLRAAQYAFAQCEDVKSFVDDLSLGQGVVLSRAASTLRSIETQPFRPGICPHLTDYFLPVNNCKHCLLFKLKLN